MSENSLKPQNDTLKFHGLSVYHTPNPVVDHGTGMIRWVFYGVPKAVLSSWTTPIRCLRILHDMGVSWNGWPWLTAWWLYTHPSKKYEFVNWDDDIPNISGKIKNVPNHQPDSYCCLSSFAGELPMLLHEPEPFFPPVLAAPCWPCVLSRHRGLLLRVPPTWRRPQHFPGRQMCFLTPGKNMGKFLPVKRRSTSN